MTAVAIPAAVEVAPQAQSYVSPSRWRSWAPWALLVVAVGLFIYGARTIPAAVPSGWGLLAVASPAYGASILVVTVAAAVAVRRRNMKAAVVATLLMIVVQRLPRTIATDTPMYAWTYKHLGVVDYIQHAHTLARDVDIYNGWPGLFALTAWFSDITGLPPVVIAHWFTPLFHLAFGVMVFAVARAWGLSPLTAVTATFMVSTINWVEQDYFSPQATTMILATGILALMGLSRERPVGVWLIMILFAAATVTHQLTPYWLMLAIGLLTFTRKMKPWWLVFPLAAMAFGFLVYNWKQVSDYTLFSPDVIENIKPNIPVKGVWGQRITGGGVRVMAATLWIGTALVLLGRWRRKQPFWALAVLALSPLLIVTVQRYGGEAVFRVYLYSVIGCSIVLAPVVMGLLQGSVRRFVGSLIIILLATAASVQGNTGSWYANVMPKTQVDTSRIVLDQAELPAYLTAVAPVWPERSSWRYVDYARFKKDFDGLMIAVPYLAGRHFDTDEDYTQFIRALNSRPDASTYLIMTEQMHIYSWYYGILPWDALPNLKQRLYQDTDNWTPFYDGQGISVFRHKVDTSVLNGG
jgi:hypothetical protein